MTPPAPLTRLRRLVGGLLAGTALLAACQAPTPVGPTPKRSPRDDAPRVTATGTPDVAATPTATPAPSATPEVAATAAGPTATPAATATPALVADAPLDLLVKPPGASALVTGAVRLDASYIVATGAGNILSHNGGAIVAAGAGNILSHNGGAVLSHNGGAIVAASAGNVISHNGGALVAAGAGNLLGSGGAGIVAAGAGNILSHNGGAYRLTQAAATAAPVATGEVAAAAGVEVAVRSLRTGAYLPVGVDKDGKPVYVVYTNLEGGYALYVPEAEQGQVMIEAAVARDKKDPRLEYQTLSGVAAGVDEDATVVTEVLRRSFAMRIRTLLREDDEATALEAMLGSSRNRIKDVPGAELAFKQVFGQLWRAADAAGLTAEQDQQVLYNYAYAVTDALLRKFDLAKVQLTPGVYWDGVEEPAIPALIQIIRQAREKATERLRANPGFFATLDWFKAVNQRTVAAGRRTTPWEIKRPADLGPLVTDEFIVIDPGDDSYDFSPPVTAEDDCVGDCQFHLDALKTVLKSLDAAGVPAAATPDGEGEGPARRTKKGYDQVDRLNQAQFNIILQIVLHMISLPAADKAEVLGVFDRYEPGAATN
jgi:hypothetical protein